MPRRLSSRSTADSLRREAKRWRKSMASGDREALARFHRLHPGHSGLASLREVQQALARDYGFACWAELKQEIEDRARTAEDILRLFLEKSVNRYGTDPSTGTWGDYERDEPARGALAARLLRRNPEIARENIHAAVAAHDVEAVRQLLGMSPDIGDDRNFRALHYTTHRDALEIARLLIARGAEIDPCEERHGGTPLTHAGYWKRTEMKALLASHSHNLRGLCRAGAVERLRGLLAEEPGLVDRQERTGETALFCLPDDEGEAVAVAELLLSFGADAGFRNPLGQTPAQAARRRGLDEAADLMET